MAQQAIYPSDQSLFMVELTSQGELLIDFESSPQVCIHPQWSADADDMQPIIEQLHGALGAILRELDRGESNPVIAFTGTTPVSIPF